MRTCQYECRVICEPWNQTDVGSFFHHQICMEPLLCFRDYVPGAGDTVRKKVKVPTIPEVTFSWKTSDNTSTNIICQIVT